MTLLPFHIGPQFGCDFLNNEYKKYLSDFPDSSDFPKIGDDYYCPLPKVSSVLGPGYFPKNSTNFGLH